MKTASDADLRLGDCLDVMQTLADNSIDLTVTSPPYDNLRTYNGFTFDFEGISRELYRVTKPGGVVVWVVGDATVKGSETGTSFRQALYFKDVCGFNLHDTMIWRKTCPPPMFKGGKRYTLAFEYMFVLSKGQPSTFNEIRVDAASSGTVTTNPRTWTIKTRERKGPVAAVRGETRPLRNVWDIYSPRASVGHPAPFPESLARDHILSWSNEGDTVLDPFLGSGTTGKIALQNGRKFVGIEISPEYLTIATDRIAEAVPSDLFATA